MTPRIARNLSHLLALLPQNGLGARVAPIPWVLSGKPASYYLITASSIPFVPFVDSNGFPVKYLDGKLVPADAAYSKSQAESSRIKAEETMRAARAGETVADTDIRAQLRAQGELDELLIESHSGIMKPDGKAWGVKFEDGVPVNTAPSLVTEEITGTWWREISDEPVSLKSLQKALKNKTKPRRRV